MKIGWFSCGIASTVACDLVKDAELRYIDISTAHPDNERFINDFELKTGRKVERVKGKFDNQFDVIKKRNYINGIAGAACTRELKMQVRWDLAQEQDVHIMGYTIEESKRANLFRLNNIELKVLFPLIEK